MATVTQILVERSNVKDRKMLERLRREQREQARKAALRVERDRRLARLR